MFDLEIWKEKLQARLPGWKAHMQAAGAHSLYGFLSALALWPLVEAAQAGQLLPVAMALGSVAGGVGGNLLAEQVLRWKDRTAENLASEAVAWTTAQAANPEVRDALDAVLLKLDVLPQAQAALAAADRAWFAQILRGEMERLGNLKRYEAILLAPGAVAQDHSVAVHQGIGVGRDLIVTIYQQAPGQPQMTEQALGPAVDRYLDWVVKNYGKLNLRGIERREEGALTLTLNDVYVSLAASVRPQRKKGRGKDMGAEEEAGEPQTLDMSQLLGLGPRLVIIGGPGSGKTTFLHVVASSLAQALRTNDAEAVERAWGLQPPLPLPIFVSLADYNHYRRKHKRSTDPHKGTLLTFLSESLIHQQAAVGLPQDFFERLLMQGQSCMALLDGLDEVANERERALARQAVEDLAHLQGIGYMLVTSRTRAYQEQSVLPETFRLAMVQPMSPEQVKALARRWCEAVYSEFEAPTEIAHLQAEIANLEALRQARGEPRLVDSPLLTTIVAIVHYNDHRLPEERAELYEKCVDVLLADRHKQRTTEAMQELVDWGGSLTENATGWPSWPSR